MMSKCHKKLHQGLFLSLAVNCGRMQYTVNGVLHSVSCTHLRNNSFGYKINHIFFLAADCHHCKRCKKNY